MKIGPKVIIVTGASSGIGRATAKLLSEHGAKVVLVARRAKKLATLAKELPGSLAVPTDMTNPQAIRRMVEKAAAHFGQIDGLINNAGRGYDAPIEDIAIGEFEYLFRLNVIGPMVAMQAVIPWMKKQGGGSIVNISSGTSLKRIPNVGAYAATKRALNGLTLTAREELAPLNIIVSLVYPTVTATDFPKNKIKDRQLSSQGWEAADYLAGDSPEYVAELILEALRGGEAEVFAQKLRQKKVGNQENEDWT